MASTSTTYQIQIDGRNVKAWAEFYPGLSWVKMIDLGKQRSQGDIESLLVHERLHYSITILTAKKVKQFLEKHRVHTNSALNNVDQQFHNWRESLNKSYDSESNHGDDILGQDKWNKEIKKQLDSLNDIHLEKKPVD